MVKKKLYEWKPISARLVGRPKVRRGNDIKEVVGIMRVNNWAICIQDGVNGRR
jgi:hypothetical protein